MTISADKENNDDDEGVTMPNVNNDDVDDDEDDDADDDADDDDVDDDDDDDDDDYDDDDDDQSLSTGRIQCLYSVR